MDKCQIAKRAALDLGKSWTRHQGRSCDCGVRIAQLPASAMTVIWSLLSAVDPFVLVVANSRCRVLLCHCVLLCHFSHVGKKVLECEGNTWVLSRKLSDCFTYRAFSSHICRAGQCRSKTRGLLRLITRLYLNLARLVTSTCLSRVLIGLHTYFGRFEDLFVVVDTPCVYFPSQSGRAEVPDRRPPRLHFAICGDLCQASSVFRKHTTTKIPQPRALS